jgi:hypothetical protein
MAEDWKPLVGALATALVTLLTFLLPRLWPDNSRRVQSDAEARIKRLEALDKAFSVTKTAKTTLGIDIATNDLQNELQQIVREFASPAVLSRDALETWSRQSLLFRLTVSPNFTVPADKARIIQNAKYTEYMLFVAMALIFGSYFAYVFDINTIRSIIEPIIPLYLTFVLMGELFCFYIFGIYLRFRLTTQALGIVRAMPESSNAERTNSISPAQSAADS